MKTFLLVFLFTFHLIPVFSIGKQPENRISLFLGGSYLARQDLIFSPFVHHDFSLMNVGFEYQRNAGYYQQIGLDFGSFAPMLTEPYHFLIDGESLPAMPHSFNLVDIDYTFGKSLPHYSQLIVGAAFTADVQAFNYVYGRFGAFGYYAAMGLGPFVKKQWSINDKSDVTLALKVPLVSWLARSPFLVNDDEYIANIASHSGVKTFAAFLADGRPVTLNKWQTFDFDLAYCWQFMPDWQIGAAWQFAFARSVAPRMMTSYRHSLNLSIHHQF